MKFKNILISILCLTLMNSLVINVQAANTYGEGTLLALENVKDAAVYYIADDGQKYVFPDAKTYYTWYNDFSTVIRVGVDVLDQYNNGGSMPYRAGTKLITHSDTSKIYAVSPGGVVHWIPEVSIAVALYGADWYTKVQDVIPGYFSSGYTKGADLVDTYPDGTIVSEGGNKYYIDNGFKRLFSDNAFLENNFKEEYVINVGSLANYQAGSQIRNQERSLAGFTKGVVDDTDEVIEEEEVIPEETIIHDEKIIFLAQSIGINLYDQGKVEQWFEDYNTTNHTSYDISLRRYPDTPYSLNNYIYDYWYLWVNGGCDSTQANIECLASLASKYDVISFKHTSAASDVLGDSGIAGAGYDRKTIEAYQGNYRALLAEFDKYPDTIFVVWTLPPRHNLFKPASGLRNANATRATEFSNWLKNEWLTEDGQNHSNVFVFDFRSYVIGEDNFLKYDYRTTHTWPDDSPNQIANEYLGPVFSDFIVQAMKGFF